MVTIITTVTVVTVEEVALVVIHQIWDSLHDMVDKLVKVCKKEVLQDL